METKRKALGKGLEDLFGDTLDLNEVEKEITLKTPKNEIKELELTELRSNPYQPRKTFDEEKLQELASSIKEHGVFQPIIVKKSIIKGYEIVAGERRVRASIMAGKTTIPAIIKDFSDQEMMEIALLENLQRENLNAIEEASAYEGLIKSLSLTQEELAKKLGKSRSHITNMLGLLNLNEKVKKEVRLGNISAGHARVLSKMSNEEQIEKLAEKVISEGLSVRELEKISQDENVEKKHVIVKKPTLQNEIFKDFEESLEDKLGTKVSIKNKKIEIYFNNKNDLERILEILEVE
jgi:chromosome partitioning protein parB family